MCIYITLELFCQDPASPGWANPTYAEIAGVIALSFTNNRPVTVPRWLEREKSRDNGKS